MWKSDGTPEGTGMVKDIFPGGSGSNLSYLSNMNGSLFFSAYNGTHGKELWKSDGTSEGTGMVKDINSGFGGSTPSYFTDVNGSLFFSANDGVNGAELWKSDSTPEGTVMVKDINPGHGSFPENLTNLNGTLYFKAKDSDGYKLWKSDGTVEGTVPVDAVNNKVVSTSINHLFPLGNVLYFSATSGNEGQEVWRTDGTEEGTFLAADINPGTNSSHPSNFVNIGSTLYFKANDGGIKGNELWKYEPDCTDPVPLFSSNQACAGKEITFANSSQNVDETATYHWDFGDGTTGTDKGIFKHIYADPGDYTVMLTITQGGCSASWGYTVTVNPLPEVTLAPFDDVIETDPAFALSGGSPAGGTYSGPGVIEGMFDPSAVGPGKYKIIYTYVNLATGCKDTANQYIMVVPVIHESTIESFTLVNAATDTDIMELTDGMQLYLQALPNAPLNIRANTDPATVGSVFLSLDGPVKNSRKENVAPYALLGDENGDYNGENLGVGSYTITATLYSQANLKGEKGPSLSLDFEIVEEVLDCEGFTASLTNVQDVSTCGGSDGAATVEVGGNTGAVTYDWSNGATTATASNLAAGDYTVIVMDEQGCAAMLSVTIENPSLPEVALSPFDPVNSTDVAFVLSGGSPAGGTYSGPGVSNGMFDPSAVGAGSYEIIYTYTDPETNCTNTVSQLITVGNEAITLVLVNTATQQDLFPLHDQSVIDLSVVGTEIGIRAEISIDGTIKRTRFELTGDGYEHIRVEGDIQPYSVFGDIGEMINPWPADDLKEGTYTLKAKPTIRINGVKEILTHTIDFTVVNGQVANLRVSNTGKAGVDKVIEEEATELFPQKITVYPNPFAKVIRIAIADLTDERVEVHLMDLYGRTILLKNMMTSAGKLELEVDAENLPEGTYLLQVKGGEHVKVVKLIKQN